MSELPCNLNVFLQANFGQENVVFRTDLLLPQPILLTPVDNAHICLTAERDSPTHIALAWTAVAGANTYVLQWSDSESMDSDSLRQVLTASTAFTLVRNRDIRLGQTIYWRVFALNLSGGISLPSEVRQLRYTCPQLDGRELPNKSSTFNIEAEMLGPDTVRSCEDTTYYIKVSFTGFDANQREICRLDSVDWTAEYVGEPPPEGEPAPEGEVEIIPEDGNQFRAFLNARPSGELSHNVRVKATLNFTDLISAQIFTKELTKEVISEPFTYGCGLTCVEECVTSDPNNKTFKVAVDFDQLAGDGLIAYDPVTDPELNPQQPCGCKELRVDLGCNLKFDDEKKIEVDLDSIAGEGLRVQLMGDNCPKLAADLLEYTAGCGLQATSVPGSGTVEFSLNPSDYAIAGNYTWDFYNCAPSTLLEGCSTSANIGSTAGVAILQGQVYYQVVGNCHNLHARAHLPFNCSLELNTGNLGVNFGIFGAGLRVKEPFQGGEGCLTVELCADTLVNDPPVNVTTCLDGASDLDECSLSAAEKGVVYGKVYHHPPTIAEQASGSCGELVVKSVLPVGCHFNLASGKLELDLTALAGANLSIDNSGSCPKLQADLGDLTPCTLPEILGLCDAPVVTPTTSMFVLGLNPTGPGECCIVKFAITECPPLPGVPDPDPGPI